MCWLRDCLGRVSLSAMGNEGIWGAVLISGVDGLLSTLYWGELSVLCVSLGVWCGWLGDECV